jgi:hypothetical protein
LDDYSWLRSIPVDKLLRHPLVVAGLQLLVAALLAYIGTERWQRWRQRRDFQYRVMSKLSETSTELFVLLGDMLSTRARHGVVIAEKEQHYIDRRTAFHALEAEIMASFTMGEILSDYDALNAKAKELFDLALAPPTQVVSLAEYEPIQNEFTKLRKRLFGRMVVEMKLLTRKERRELEKDPNWSIEDHSGP